MLKEFDLIMDLCSILKLSEGKHENALNIAYYLQKKRIIKFDDKRYYNQLSKAVVSEKRKNNGKKYE